MSSREEEGAGVQLPKYVVLENPRKDLRPVTAPWLLKALQPIANMPGIEREHVQCPLVNQFFDASQLKFNTSEFGKQCRQELFQLEENWNFLNHGSYGATLKLASDVQSWYRRHMEGQPLRFMDTDVHPLLHQAVEEVAEIVQADVMDVVPLINTTMAVNAVAKSINFQKDDLILMTSETYGAVKNTLIQVAEDRGVGIIIVNLPFQTLKNRDEIIQVFVEAIEAHHKRIKFALIDHIFSFPPVVMPVKQICAICKQHNIKVMIDGAHAIGQIPLNIPDIGADFYASNLHKWLCTPKGTAILWVSQREQSQFKPLITSHGYGQFFSAHTWWIGTQDWTAWLAVPAALKIMKKFGLENVQQYNRQMVTKAARMLQTAFKTGDPIGGLADVGEEKQYTSSFLGVELPKLKQTQFAELNQVLRKQFQVEVPIIGRGNKAYARISCQIYNQFSEYEILREAILELM